MFCFYCIYVCRFYFFFFFQNLHTKNKSLIFQVKKCRFYNPLFFRRTCTPSFHQKDSFTRTRKFPKSTARRRQNSQKGNHGNCCKGGPSAAMTAAMSKENRLFFRKNPLACESCLWHDLSASAKNRSRASHPVKSSA